MTKLNVSGKNLIAGCIPTFGAKKPSGTKGGPTKVPSSDKVFGLLDELMFLSPQFKALIKRSPVEEIPHLLHNQLIMQEHLRLCRYPYRKHISEMKNILIDNRGLFTEDEYPYSGVVDYSKIDERGHMKHKFVEYKNGKPITVYSSTHNYEQNVVDEKLVKYKYNETGSAAYKTELSKICSMGAREVDTNKAVQSEVHPEV